MDQMRNTSLTDLHQLHSFKGKPIIDINNGQQVGVVDDILIQPEGMSLAALVLVRGNILRQDLYAIPSSDVKVWGKDVLLVSGTETLRKKNEITELDHSLSAGEATRGREIISLDGERNGELRDFLVDQDGRLEGIEVGRIGDGLANEMFVKNRFDTVRLPISSIHSMGKDVIIIDLARVKTTVAGPAVEGPAMEYPVEEQPVDEELAIDQPADGQIVEEDSYEKRE